MGTVIEKPKVKVFQSSLAAYSAQGLSTAFLMLGTHFKAG